MALLATPDGERGSPVTLARERPVYVVAEPVSEAPPLYMLGDPVYILVLPQELGEHRCSPRIPSFLGVVEKRRAAPPAVGVGVFVLLGAEEESLVTQLLDEAQICLLDERSRERADALIEGSIGLYGVEGG